MAKGTPVRYFRCPDDIWDAVEAEADRQTTEGTTRITATDIIKSALAAYLPSTPAAAPAPESFVGKTVTVLGGTVQYLVMAADGTMLDLAAERGGGKRRRTSAGSVHVVE